MSPTFRRKFVTGSRFSRNVKRCVCMSHHLKCHVLPNTMLVLAMLAYFQYVNSWKQFAFLFSIKTLHALQQQAYVYWIQQNKSTESLTDCGREKICRQETIWPNIEMWVLNNRQRGWMPDLCFFSSFFNGREMTRWHTNSKKAHRWQ